MALLFQDAVDKEIASGQPLDRASLFTVLNNDEHPFTARASSARPTSAATSQSNC